MENLLCSRHYTRYCTKEMIPLTLIILFTNQNPSLPLSTLPWALRGWLLVNRPMPALWLPIGFSQWKILPEVRGQVTVFILPDPYVTDYRLAKTKSFYSQPQLLLHQLSPHPGSNRFSCPFRPWIIIASLWVISGCFTISCSHNPVYTFVHTSLFKYTPFVCNPFPTEALYYILASRTVSQTARYRYK